MFSLDSKIQLLSGIGPVTAKKLERLGVVDISDLIYYFPRAYKDFTTITPIGRIESVLERNWAGANMTIRGEIIGIANKRTSRRRMVITEAVVADETGSMKVVWFNQPFLEKSLRAGTKLILNGKVAYDRFANCYSMESPERAFGPKIVPVYSETAGLSSYLISKSFAGIKSLVQEIQEFLPRELISENKLLGIREAILVLHQPKDNRGLDEARRRLAFDELFLVALRSNLDRIDRAKENAIAFETDVAKLKEFISNLPFELTDGQKKALWEIVGDLGRDEPMSRLLNGDVGSGKTIVALLASLAVIEAGFRVVLMSPTEILASQHYETFCRFLAGTGISVGLLTRSQKKFEINDQANNDSKKIETFNENSKLKIKNSPEQAQVVIGTHALLSEKVKLEKVGLIIVDEQHRFGVAQRQALRNLSFTNSYLSFNESLRNLSNEKIKNNRINAKCQIINAKLRPHFLSMTATPIPRTLQLALFGDLDFSIIKDKPVDRKEIKTRFVEPHNRSKAYDFIREQLRRGRQTFVICPLIEEKQAESGIMNYELWQDEERKSVTKEYEKLSKQIFPDFKVGMLHGKMKPKEKEEVMGKFKSREIDVLVSTSVVEVGVDIPNATVMMIEDAERFGLAQIHQFRGRVGRGEHQSFCFLFSNSGGAKVRERLEGLERISDGFRLAQLDLEQRGPGAIFGTEQSGLLDLKMASLSDLELIEKASRGAKKVAGEIDKHPDLKRKLSEQFLTKHLE